MRTAQQSFNSSEGYFSPATDLVVSLAIVFIIIIAFEISEVARLNRELKGEYDLEEIQNMQQQLIASVAERVNAQASEDRLDPDRYTIEMGDVEGNVITITNEATLQQITFGGQLLFETGDRDLKPGGETALQAVGASIKELVDNLDIEIQGHADTQPTGYNPITKAGYESNLHLAAMRAITVYDFFQNTLGIDPYTHVMSIASYGEYLSVQRANQRQSIYSRSRIEQDNADDELKAKNRRIEIRLIYKQRAQ